VEPVRHQGNMLAVVWAGHPKLCHDLPRPAMEDIGARATILTLEGIQG
jgi:type II secretory pathway predicted ATPase ExeA